MNKRGRPKKENVRDREYRVRLNEEEQEILRYLSIETDKSMAEILRDGLQLQYKMHTKSY